MPEQKPDGIFKKVKTAIKRQVVGVAVIASSLGDSSQKKNLDHNGQLQ